MDLIFGIIFIFAVSILCATNPSIVLPTLTLGSEKGLKLCFTLMVIYSVWLAIIQVFQDSGLAEKLSKLLYPIIRKLFKGNPSYYQDISMNLTGNILGIGAISTPYGISSIEKMTKDKNFFGCDLLFVISATSIQILPATVISLRNSFLSSSASDIFLPTVLATAFSTFLGISLCFLTRNRKK